MSDRKLPSHSLRAASGSAALARSIIAASKVGLSVAESAWMTNTASPFSPKWSRHF
jgi:hypothetical protein